MRRLWLGAATAAWLVIPASARLADDAGLVSGSRRVHIVQAGDSLARLGARFGIEPRVIARMNSLAADSRLRTGQRIVLDDRHLVPAAAAADEIVINIPQRMLFHFVDGTLAAANPVAVGNSDWPTFVGPFTVTSLELDPVWDVPLSIQQAQRQAGQPVLNRVPPGPTNPLGRHWIGLDRPGFGIHGTSAPGSIFGYRTHGCIRLHPDDVAALFRSTSLGASGRTIYEPVLVVEVASRILIEAHPDPYRRQRDALGVVRTVALERGLTARIDWKAVAVVLREREGTPVDVAVRPARP
jgi:L,D-transpeptidase ErfK/SrfK